MKTLPGAVLIGPKSLETRRTAPLYPYACMESRGQSIYPAAEPQLLEYRTDPGVHGLPRPLSKNPISLKDNDREAALGTGDRGS